MDTHISIILDRSGSMERIREETIGGFNRFLEEQRRQPGRATLTLVQFDSQDPYEVIHPMRPLEEVPPLTPATFKPRGCTPLLDAMGRGVLDLDRVLDGMGEEERPAAVLFVVLTDGLENASRDFTREKVAELLRDRQERCWEFVFLGARFESVQEARSLGLAPADSVMFYLDPDGVRDAWQEISRRAITSRAAVADR